MCHFSTLNRHNQLFKMATSIKSIPVLKANEAKNFDAKVTANATKKATINFTKQSVTASKILAKAKI